MATLPACCRGGSGAGRMDYTAVPTADSSNNKSGAKRGDVPASYRDHPTPQDTYNLPSEEAGDGNAGGPFESEVDDSSVLTFDTKPFATGQPFDERSV